MSCELKSYDASMLGDIDAFYRAIFAAMSWHYDPADFHADVFDIPRVYQLGGLFSCLYDGDELVGTVAVKRLDDKTCELKRLYLAERVRGHGYGRLLLNHAIDEARALGYGVMRLDTIAKRQAARGLFAAFGFREIERYNDNPRAEIWMELAL